MTEKEYVEAVCTELCRVRGKGLLPSSADAAAALAWHASGVPLPQALAAVRSSRKPALRGDARAAVATSIPLRALRVLPPPGVRARRPQPPEGAGLSQELLLACHPQLPARAAWQAVAAQADALLSQPGGRDYWSAVLSALRESLGQIPRESALRVGRELRRRMVRRPPHMPRTTFRRSLELQLLACASELLGVPPKPFLL